MKRKLSHNRGFSLIELLVAMSIIALLSSVVFATLSKARTKARDMARISNARQLAIALEQYEQSNNSYKMSNCGYNNEGGGFVTKGSETSGYTNSIAEQLKAKGYYNSAKLLDPVFGADNYYIGLCTSTNAYNVFVKLEQTEYNAPTSTIANTCGGTDALAQGFSFIGSTTGGSSGVITPGVNINTFAAAYEQGMGPNSSPSGGGGGETAQVVAAVGSLDTGYNSATGPNSGILSINIQSNGKILIGGSFSTYDGISRKYIASLNTDGTLDTSFNPGTGAGSSVYATYIQPDGKIIIGGDFITYNGTARSRVARINADGTLDTSFNPGSGVNNIVSSIGMQSDGKIIIVGYFTNFNGTARNRIARLNTDGTLDTSFNPGTGPGSDLYAVKVQPDGKILIGGYFNTYNGATRKYIARINSDGTNDSSFDSSLGADFSVSSIGLQSDGKILIAGSFTKYGAVSRNSIARLNSNGSLDTSFNPGLGADSDILSIAIQSDGKIVVVGMFTSYNGTSRSSIARVNTDGTLDTSFSSGIGPNNAVTSVIVQPDGKVVVGGYFTTFGGATKKYIARMI